MFGSLQKIRGIGAMEKRQEIYRELTARGKRFCAVAGLLEEIAVFAWLDISFGIAPAAVLFFLWFLFTLLTGAALIGVDNLHTVASCMCKKLRRILYWRLAASCRRQSTPAHRDTQILI